MGGEDNNVAVGAPLEASNEKRVTKLKTEVRIAFRNSLLVTRLGFCRFAPQTALLQRRPIEGLPTQTLVQVRFELLQQALEDFRAASDDTAAFQEFMATAQVTHQAAGFGNQ